MMTEIIYNGRVIGTVSAGESKILKCNGKKMKSDVEIRAGARTVIKYDGEIVAIVAAGESKIIKCAGEILKHNIEIRVDGEAAGTPGTPGISPTVEITAIEGGNRITITDVNGPHIADVKDGKDGEDGYTPQKGVDYFDGKNGSDGISPTVSVSNSGKVTSITITDKNGTKTATINDGSDGKTPVKGTDFWTDADRQAMISDVIATLPVYDGEAVIV